MPSILDPDFRYVNAASTNVAATFARIRREQEAERAFLDVAADALTKAADTLQADNDKVDTR